MSVQPLDTFYNELVKTIYHDIAFYIPSTLIQPHILESIRNEIPPNFLDSIFILDVHLGLGKFEFIEFNQRILKKPNLFEQNIFQLLQKRKELNDIEFEYIINKYFDQVEFYAAIMSWLSANLITYNKDKIDINTVGLFEIQREIYSSHFEELINCFYNPEEVELRPYYDISEIVNIYIPDLVSKIDQYTVKLPMETIIGISTQEIIDSKEVDSTEKNETKLKVKTKKEPLITEKEAEDFLLNTVFNIKTV